MARKDNQNRHKRCTIIGKGLRFMDVKSIDNQKMVQSITISKGDIFCEWLDEIKGR